MVYRCFATSRQENTAAPDSPNSHFILASVCAWDFHKLPLLCLFFLLPYISHKWVLLRL
jgi:hypothetical protein